MDIKRLVVGPVSTNCYFVAAEHKCVLVDPGGEFEKIVTHIERYNYEPVAILLTHGHFDHIMAVNQLIKKYEETKKMLKQFSGGGNMSRKMNRMFRGFR